MPDGEFEVANAAARPGLTPIWRPIDPPSFLPESDVERIVQYAASTGKRSYAALIPDNPYGTVVEAAFRQAVASSQWSTSWSGSQRPCR